MNMHICYTSDGTSIPCLCVRDRNHSEALFDVPVGDEEEDFS